MAKKTPASKTVETLVHEDATRRNIPTAEYQSVLKAEIDADAWATLHSDTSRPFPKPTTGRIAVKVINHLGDEVMKVFRV